MPDFVLNRNYTHRSTNGHIITFKRGEPVYVPPIIVNEVVAIGAEPCDGGKIDILPLEKQVPQPLTEDERQKQVFAAFEQLTERNARETFTAQGVPTIQAVQNLTGISVAPKLMVDYWRKYKDFKRTQE